MSGNSILGFLIALIVVGAILYILNALPIDATVKKIGQVVVIVAFAIYALRLLWPMAA